LYCFWFSHNSELSCFSSPIHCFSVRRRVGGL
jgi:hypothetical protein